jgi:hypothetical protein
MMQGSVTGIMITLGHDEATITESIEDFFRQTIQNGPLIIAGPAVSKLATGKFKKRGQNILWVNIDGTEADVLDAALGETKSSFGVIWSASARHHPRRIEEQMRAFSQPNTIGCGLSMQLIEVHGSFLHVCDMQRGVISKCSGMLPDTLLFLRRNVRVAGTTDPFSTLFHGYGRHGHIATLAAPFLHVQRIGIGAYLRFTPSDKSHLCDKAELDKRKLELESELSDIVDFPLPMEVRDVHGAVVFQLD